jgi:hypothetical protein
MSLSAVAQTSTTAAVTVLTGPGALVSVLLCGGADAATCTVYDNTSAAGTVIAKLGVGAGLSASFTPAHPIAVGTGIHVALTGTTPQINVAYI